MSIADDIDDALKGAEGLLDALGESTPVYSLQEQIALGEEKQKLGLRDSCPLCGMEMGEMKRCRLRAGEQSWILCSPACAMFMFKRQFPRSTGIASSIEAFNPQRRNHP